MTTKIYPLYPGDSVSIKNTRLGLLIHCDIDSEASDLLLDTSELVSMVRKDIDRIITSYFSSPGKVATTDLSDLSLMIESAPNSGDMVLQNPEVLPFHL